MFKIMITSFAATFLWVMAVRADAGQGSPAQRLSRVQTVTCVFDTKASGDWDAATGAARGEVKPASLRIVFESINIDEGSARVVGQVGNFEIIVRLSGGTLHLLQSFNEGPLYATTIFPEQDAKGRLRAVHTRHEFTQVSLPGFTSRPEQYYGLCEVK